MVCLGPWGVQKTAQAGGRGRKNAASRSGTAVERRCRKAMHRICVALLGLTVVGCGGAAPPVEHPTSGPPQVVAMDELHITAERSESGDYDFQVYDASELFTRATDMLNHDRCTDAVKLYDKLNQEFPDSDYISASLYNAGLCLQQSRELAAARDRFVQLRERVPGSPDIKDATFQLAEVLVDLERFQDGVAIAEELLGRQDLNNDERLEALTRRAQALLGGGQLDDAAQQAKSALTFFRTRPEAESVRDDFFAAAANYVLAETLRLRGQSLEFPVGTVEEQKAVLIRRAELLLEAQREYFNTIHFSNVRWTAASGYRIGHMYDELWHSIMAAPVPPHLPPEGHVIYRQELAKLIKPLVRHAIRYWEVTLLLLERTGYQSEWTAQTRVDLERVRKLLLEQPEGPGGLPTPGSEGQSPAAGESTRPSSNQAQGSATTPQVAPPAITPL